jgi:hypothetical protein
VEGRGQRQRLECRRGHVFQWARTIRESAAGGVDERLFR